MKQDSGRLSTMKGRATNRMDVREWKRQLEGGALLKEEMAILTGTGEGEMEGRGSSDLQEDVFEEFNATVDVVTCFPEL